MIAIGHAESQATALLWETSMGLTYLVLADPAGSTYGLFGDGYVPFNAIIDGNMNMVYSDSGYSSSVIIGHIEAQLPLILWISHAPLGDIEATGTPREVSAEITSNQALTAEELYYRVNGSSWNMVAMAPSGQPDTFTANIPGQPAGTNIDYYLRATDAGSRVRVVPRTAPTAYYSYHVGPDNTPPTLQHEPLVDRPEHAFPAVVRAFAEDNLGIESVELTYDKGAGPVTVPMTLERNGWYTAEIPGPVEVGDTIQYRIVATDGSIAGNETALPSSGYYSFMVIEGLPVYLWNLDGGTSSVTAFQTACSALGVDYDTGTAAPANLVQYRSVFVMLGMYGVGGHVLTSAEGQALAGYLDTGGRLYMEGGDTWAYDPATAVHPYFHITGSADGASDTVTIQGQTGTFTEGQQFAYSGDNAYMDRILPEGGSGAVQIWRNSPTAYCNGVAYQGASYRTIGASFEFRGLTDATAPSTKTEAMRRYLEFFQVPIGATTPTPTAPPATATPTPTTPPATATPTPTTPPATATPTGEPTATPTLPPDEPWYDLVMPDDHLTPGETFLLQRAAGNPGAGGLAVDEYIALEVYGQYWWYPGWTQDLDKMTWVLDPVSNYLDDILEFTWPTGAGELDGVRFWGAFLEAGTLTELVDYDMVEWGFGE